MSHASKTSLFQQRLQNALAVFTQRAQRICVGTLPQTTRDAMRNNERKLSLFSTDLSEDQRELILHLLNSDWSIPIEEGLVHFCAAGCCSDDAEFRRRMATALQAAMGGFFDTPLLYRWKYFDPAAEFTARGLAIHAMLRTVWRWCRSDSADVVENLAAQDEDDADLNPAQRQQVRMNKVQIMLDDAAAPVCWLDIVF